MPSVCLFDCYVMKKILKLCFCVSAASIVVSVWEIERKKGFRGGLGFRGVYMGVARNLPIRLGESVVGFEGVNHGFLDRPMPEISFFLILKLRAIGLSWTYASSRHSESLVWPLCLFLQVGTNNVQLASSGSKSSVRMQLWKFVLIISFFCSIDYYYENLWLGY